MGDRPKSHRLVAFAAVLASLAGFAGGPADAQFFTNSAGLASPATTITFSEVAVSPGTPVTNQFVAFGATFTNVVMTPPPFSGNNVANITFPDLANFDSNSNPFGPITISFNTPLTGAAFAVIANQQPTTFDALLGGSIVASGSAPTETFVGKYVGFSGITFDAIRFSPAGRFARLDNLQIGPSAAVPEPSQSIAILVGCLGMVAAARANRRTQAR